MGESQQTESVGQYRLGDVRIEGTVARVYRAVDRTDGRHVVVRVLDPLVSRNPQMRAILEELRDVRSPRRMQDPHVLHLLDVGLKGESYYLVYEDFDGLPLDQFIREKRPTLQESLQLARLIAESLRAVHGHRVIHGDVKPQSILVGRDRFNKFIVKLAPADLAVAAPDAAIAIYGELVGTPKYLAPERIQGKLPTGAADIFALGVIFYELFTGREPYSSATPIGYLSANMSGRASPACVVDTTVPTDLSRVIGRMMAADPRDRYRTAQAVIDDLDRVESDLNGVAHEAVQPGADSIFAVRSPGEGSREAAWRSIAITSATAAALMLVALIVALVMNRDWGRGEESSPSPRAPSARKSRTGETLPAAPTTTVETRSQAAAKDWAGLQEQVAQMKSLGKYDEAFNVLARFLAKHKDSYVGPFARNEAAGVLTAKAESLLAAGDTQKAIEIWQTAARDYPDTENGSDALAAAGDALLDRAAKLEARGELDAAVATLDLVIAQFPSTAPAAKAAARLAPLRLRLAQILLSSQPDKAIALMQGALKGNLPSADAAAARKALAAALFARGEARLREKKPQEALLDLRESVVHDASYKGRVALREPEALVAAARQLKDAGRIPEAAAAWKEARERFPYSAAVSKAADEMQSLSTVAAVAATPAPASPTPAPAAPNASAARTPKGMVLIPAGEFAMGLSDARKAEIMKDFRIPAIIAPKWLDPQTPETRLRMRAYFIDQHEVTNEDYKAYIDATKAPPPPDPYWSGRSIKPGGERLPVTNVTWEEAAAYARWAGKRLPTEAEWEKAARGSDGRLFPWGNSFDAKRCVNSQLGLRTIEPVNSIPDGNSPYGIADMIGNAQEWTADTYRPYLNSPSAEGWVDDGRKAVRGASFDEMDAVRCLATWRDGVDPNTRSAMIGFRCVKDAE